MHNISSQTKVVWLEQIDEGKRHKLATAIVETVCFTVARTG